MLLLMVNIKKWYLNLMKQKYKLPKLLDEKKELKQKLASKHLKIRTTFIT